MSLSTCNCHLNPARKCPHFDMTDLPRHRTDFTEAEQRDHKLLNEMNERYNALCEKVEDLWIELDCQLLDAMEADKNRKKMKQPRKRVSKKELFDDCPEDIMSELSQELEMDFE